MAIIPADQILYDDFARPVKIHICKDGTISYRRPSDRILNGVAMPVFSVDNEDQAQAIQIRFGRQQYVNHPEQPDRPWYRISVLGDGKDPVLRDGKGFLEVDDLPGITNMFRDYWKDHLGGIVNIRAGRKRRVSA
jgi:hypothetical protein